MIGSEPLTGSDRDTGPRLRRTSVYLIIAGAMASVSAANMVQDFSQVFKDQDQEPAVEVDTTTVDSQDLVTTTAEIGD